MSHIQKYTTALNELTIHYRVLTAADAEAYRDIRMRALDTEGKYFTADREKERARKLEEWQAACSETTKRAKWGAFAGNDLIAISNAEEIAAERVKWGSTYVRPELRGANIVRALYIMREEWSVTHGYKNAEFTIRADNSRSREIHEKNGASPIRTEVMKFADGSSAPTILYQKHLRDVRNG